MDMNCPEPIGSAYVPNGLEWRLARATKNGLEVTLMRGMGRFHRLKKVLPQYEAELNALVFLKTANYRFFRIAPTGLVPENRLVAGLHRDYFLTASCEELSDLVEPS